jgi:hypothetical protein
MPFEQKQAEAIIMKKMLRRFADSAPAAGIGLTSGNFANGGG